MNQKTNKWTTQDTTFTMILICLIIILMYLIFTSDFLKISEQIDPKGLITDKFILSDRGWPNYFFILDNKTQREVTVQTYYKYEKGEYYENR